MLFIILLLAGITGIAVYVSVNRLRVAALQRNMVDRPNERSSHTVPVPRVGGIPIFFWSWLLVLVVFSGLALFAKEVPVVGWSGFILGAFLIGAVSLLEDVRELPRLLRFGIHAAAAALVLWPLQNYARLELPIIGDLLPVPVVMLLCLIWVVGLTNAYNFMDGIDGIAGIQGLVAGFGWMFIGIGMNQSLLTALGAVLTASSAGFLLHNWAPARIFMGDVGSTFLGFSFAAMPFLAFYNSGPADPGLNVLILLAVLLVWPFVLDASFTFLRRLKNRENVFAAHRSHLYQRLAAKYKGNRTANHRRTSTIYGLLAASGLIWSHFIFHAPDLNPLGSLLTVAILFAALVAHTFRVEAQ